MTSLEIRGNSAAMKRAEQLKRWEESDTNREPPTPRPEPGRKIKFSSGCVFLAACLSGDKEEVVKLIQQGADINTANVDGLTALHQACIDDNLEMVEFLVEHGADINRQDNEGWTPLHATASCGFVSIARYLVEHSADVSAVNSDGDLAVDLAVDIQHLAMIDFMQKMVTEHKIDCEKARQAEEQLMLNDAKKWLRSDASEVDRPHPKTGATALHVAAAKGYTKVLSLLLAGRANVDKQDNDGWTPLHAAAHWGQKEAAEMLVDAMADMEVRNYAGQTSIDVADRKMVKFLEELRANNKRIKRRPSSQIRISDAIENHIDNTPTKIIRVELKHDQAKDQANEKSIGDSYSKLTTDPPTDEEAPWRRNSSSRVRTQNESPTKNQVPEKDVSKINSTTESSDVILRRTQSFENDEKFYQKYNELRARIKANSCPILPANTQNSNNNNNNNNNSNNISNPTSVLGNVNTTTPTIQNYSVQRSASLKDHRHFRKPPTAPPATPATVSTATTASSASITTPIRRSFVPPVRDEESETQRKAHAKRVRETRRSTQGVTLDEIKSAEELVKKKNSNMNNNNNSSSNDTQTTTITTTTSATQQQEIAELQPPPPTSPPPTTANNVALMTPTEESRLSADKSEEKEIDSRIDEDDDITATFTIVAPIIKNRTPSFIASPDDDNDDEDDIDEDDGDDSEVSATFTMSPRRESQTPTPTSMHAEAAVETTILVTPPEIRIDEPKMSESEDNDHEHKRTEEISSSHKKINANEKEKEDKTELITQQELTKTAQPTVISATSTNRSEDARKPSESPTIERLRGGSSSFSPLPLVSQEANASSNPTTTTPTLDSPVRLRDKRSLFDLDNASSLTLAEKLRHEANKYSSSEEKPLPASASASDSDRDSVFSYNYSSRRSLDSTSLPSSPLHSKLGGGGESSGSGTAAERRPSWRLKFDAGCKFKLEDASTGTTFPPNNSTIIPSAPAVIAAANLSSSVSQRRINSVGNAINASNQSLNSIGRPVSAPSVGNTPSSNNSDNGSHDRVGDNSTATANSGVNSYTSRRINASTLPSTLSSGTNTSNISTVSAATSTTAVNKNNEDIDNDKENDNRSALTTQAVIQRRRKPKRRSTGVVHLDMDELDPERQDSANDTEEKEKESGSERTSRSRLGSTAGSSTSATDDNKSRDKSANSDAIDYKALWEAAKLENDKLKQQLKKKDEDVVQTRATLERFTNAQLEVYKTENQRLKEENGALIRVISKLSK